MFNPKIYCRLVSGALVLSVFIYAESAQAQSGPLLAIKSQHVSRGNGYLTVSGEVNNITSAPLKDVEAVSTFYDKNHNVIKIATALIEYNPVMPGQTSPFKTLTPDNPLVIREITTFKFLMGGKIETGGNTDATERNYKQHRAGESANQRKAEDDRQKKTTDAIEAALDHPALSRHDHLYDYASPLVSYKPDGSIVLPMTKEFVKLPRQKQLTVEKQIEKSCPKQNSFYFCADDGLQVIDVVHKP